MSASGVYPVENELMQTSNQLHFLHTKDHRAKRTNRPTSGTRTHNPQPQHFKTTQLPSGQFVNVSMSVGTDGHGGVPVGSGNPRDFDPDFQIDSEFRQSFKKPQQDDWHRGNTARYGHNHQPWANAHQPSVGIVPAVREDHLEATTTTNTTARDSFETGTGFSSRFSSTSSRRAPAAVDRTDLSDIDSVIKGSASGAVESWIRSAPGFEGEVVKRMLRTVSRQVATPGKSQARASKGGGAADFPSQLTTV